jgi:deoxycytidylate deaminase
MNIQKLIDLAVNESFRSRTTTWRLGAVVVRGGSVIAKGYNRPSGKTESIGKQLGIPLWTLHAEMDALLNCGTTEGSYLFVAGRKENGSRVHSKPCKKCQAFMKGLGLLGVFWEDRDGVVHFDGLDELVSRARKMWYGNGEE